MPRMRFEKTGDSVWISHLDLMRVFQRSFCRAGIPIYHSQGYNPRAYVSIALPLPVGMASVCELLDFELAEGTQVALSEIPARLNAVMPRDIRVQTCYDGGKKLRELCYLDARVILEYDRGVPEDAADQIAAFFKEPTIPVTKKGKKGPVELDIAPMLRGVSVEERGPAELALRCRVCAQNPALNPMLLVEALRRHRPMMAPDFASACRLELLDGVEQPFR